ncbi:hypothetical protein A8D65_25345 [Burkholderia cenocepacia]|uniref:YkvA family protein n=1 Tax=Burkholderiaceae TaxID=119060 RepID=UPI00098115C1|nr:MULTISPECIES: YkvA family protein [Burkholderiaceae]ONN82204.1 hypothetical protein A8D62_29955 [Burkholderia cenocepacia]ONN85932.1 hypothetical protein A8D63_20980 [Burkholderia cenocepacia]ONO24300.1 hypothetical protein A8D65_25345 [Burkholderia cenocepacia]ONO51672.1 hypothetical protein A8D73_29410 [Burkholderia cenocepacia]
MSEAGFITRSKQWAKKIKRDGVTLWFARKHPATPFLAKALAVVVVSYALSPIDLIPDFIPVLGYLDDVILLPILIWLTVRLIPDRVMAECRLEADKWLATQGSRPRSYVGAAAIVTLWIVASLATAWLARERGWI